MKIVRQEGKYQLLFEPLQKMFCLTDGKDYSLWFSEDEYSNLSVEEFKKQCKKDISYAN